ncbi:nuclear transcription factor Y subunit B-2-like [Punica granatum]|uniref:Nuclear transcription factor Y subunit B-2-like n=1 Tax=Punica granatum TaxID=22663 RepID=A0A218XRF0_PUNGR|nr:nuclear transcription factor Y subunit B-2-like [Punica granatum]OWM87218.1 hypothetical protein CDL15_Pgr010250 [Punica granatum]OWM87219.1 hypothetical protein CDL15_Pgr010251 [Punica granatum]
MAHENSNEAAAITPPEQDRQLPIANVGRIMRRALPPSAKISKGAKESMQECVTEFVNFVTGEASDHCLQEKRKTMNGDDICWALASLSFYDYCPLLKTYLERYRYVEGERATRARASYNNNNDLITSEEASKNTDEIDIVSPKYDFFAKVNGSGLNR